MIDKQPYNKKQFLDFYLIEELLSNLKWGYAARIHNKLLSHGIKLKQPVIYQRTAAVLSGATLKPAADFRGIPDNREGKDMNYAGLWALIDIFLPNKDKRKYVGLASNQIDIIKDHIYGKIIVCEHNKKRAEKLESLVGIIRDKNMFLPKIEINAGDIFSFLEITKETFNIIDLDLMTPIQENKILDKWINIINKHTLSNSITIINLATVIGRNINEKEHDKRTKYLINQLSNNHNVRYSKFSYRDRQIPMRVNRIVLIKGETNA